MHNRMKEALVLLGRIPAAHVRPPLTPVSDDERRAIAAVACSLPRSDCVVKLRLSDFRRSGKNPTHSS